MHPTLSTALAAGFGVIARRDHPELAGAIDVALRRGELRRLLPGTYARADRATSLVVRARAVCVADPDAVVTGLAAAILGGREGLRAPATLTVASQRLRRDRPGFRFQRRRIAPELVRTLDGVRFTTRALTALDLAVERGLDELDDALRRGAEPHELQRALLLTPGRRGHAPLRRAVEDLRDRPWSPLEREAHRLLRDAGIGGWRANVGLWDARGERRIGYGDLVFSDHGLVIELDGASYHTDPARDAARDLALVRAGWEVIRIGAGLVRKSPQEFINVVRDILRTREYRVGRPVRR